MAWIQGPRKTQFLKKFQISIPSTDKSPYDREREKKTNDPSRKTRS